MPFDTCHVEILGQDLILWEAREVDAEMIGQSREAELRMPQSAELVGTVCVHPVTRLQGFLDCSPCIS